MTTNEKVEDLRQDVKSIMTALNSWTASQRELGADHNRVSNLVSEVAKAVEDLERKVGE